MLEGLLGQTLQAEDRGVVSLAAMPGSGGITQSEFEALRSMTTVTEVEWYRTHSVKARAVPGATRTTIEADARGRTGNRGIYAAWISGQTKIATGPLKAVWLFIAVYGLFFMHATRGSGLTEMAALWPGGCLPAFTASLTAWAFAIQMCGATQGLTYSTLLAYCVGAMALQCRYWWLDLRQRCPVCLDRLVRF